MGPHCPLPKTTAYFTVSLETTRCDLLEGAGGRVQPAAVAAGYGGAAYGGVDGEAVVLILATDGLWEFVSDQVFFF